VKQSLSSALLALLLAPAAANGAAQDTLVGSVQSFHADDSGVGGEAASIDWVHSQDALIVDLGLTHKSIGNAEWTVGRLGAAFDIAPRLKLSGEVECGPAEWDGVDDIYFRALAQLTFTASDRLFLAFDDQYFDVERSHGHLLSAKLAYLPVRALALETRFSQSAGGNLDTQLVSARLDYFAKLHPFAGAARGRSAPGVFEVATGSGDDLRQFFFGIGIPVAGSELTLMSEWLELGDARQQIITLILAVPLTARQ